MGDEVEVSRRADRAFDVRVRRGRSASLHVVRVPAGLASELGAPGAEDAELVRQSFYFLLEREPPSSILSSFSLEVIERYFPEYRADMTRRLA